MWGTTFKAHLRKPSVKNRFLSHCKCLHLLNDCREGEVLGCVNSRRRRGQHGQRPAGASENIQEILNLQFEPPGHRYHRRNCQTKRSWAVTTGWKRPPAVIKKQKVQTPTNKNGSMAQGQPFEPQPWNWSCEMEFSHFPCYCLPRMHLAKLQIQTTLAASNRHDLIKQIGS